METTQALYDAVLKGDATSAKTLTAQALAALRTTAPTTLAPNVLVEVGLADRYARFDSPIGPLVVAWNGRGGGVLRVAA